MIPRNTLQKLPNVKSPMLLRTLAFNIKQPPDCSSLQSKEQYFVRCDKQTEVVNLFLNICTILSWYIVYFAPTLILLNGWHTKQVNYTNAFYQAHLK